MTVSELIAELQKFDPALPVCVQDGVFLHEPAVSTGQSHEFSTWTGRDEINGAVVMIK